MEKSVSVRVEDEASSSSWVVEMKKMLEDTSPSVEAETARWNQRCIYRVPEYIKNTTNSMAYRPQLVSLGPLHHGEPDLLPMEQHKRRAVLHMVKRARKPLEEFLAAIEEVADELEGAYDDLDDKWRGANRGSFVEMMTTDGCFLLELMRIMEVRNNDKGYAANDPVFSLCSFSYLWPRIRDDMIAMENQLPLFQNAEAINMSVLRLLSRPRLEKDMDKLGLHLLDIFHKSYCGVCPHWEGPYYRGQRTACAVELSEAGIKFKTSNTKGQGRSQDPSPPGSNRFFTGVWQSIVRIDRGRRGHLTPITTPSVASAKDIHGVDFENDVLSMPVFEVYDSTEIWFLNLMAFEWLHFDAKPDVASYICFVDQIIESERDVALLRSKGLFVNMIGSDKKVVTMFNTLTKLARLNTRNRLAHVQWKVNTYCRKRRNRWRASFVNNYLSNPWVFLSLVAAVILLVATLLQTVYTIVPFYKG